MKNYLQGINKLDMSFMNWIEKHTKTDFMDRVMLVSSKLGDKGAIWIVYALICTFSAGLRQVAMNLTLCISASAFLGNFALKPMFRRTRPCNADSTRVLLLARPYDSSFPSCHTMTSFAAAIVTAWQIGGFFGMSSFVFASMISFSRVYLYVHYPSDVLAGMAFGIAAGSIFLYSIP